MTTSVDAWREVARFIDHHLIATEHHHRIRLDQVALLSYSYAWSPPMSVADAALERTRAIASLAYCIAEHRRRASSPPRSDDDCDCDSDASNGACGDPVDDAIPSAAWIRRSAVGGALLMTSSSINDAMALSSVDVLMVVVLDGDDDAYYVQVTPAMAPEAASVAILYFSVPGDVARSGFGAVATHGVPRATGSANGMAFVSDADDPTDDERLTTQPADISTPVLVYDRSRDGAAYIETGQRSIGTTRQVGDAATTASANSTAVQLPLFAQRSPDAQQMFDRQTARVLSQWDDNIWSPAWSVSSRTASVSSRTAAACVVGVALLGALLAVVRRG